MSDDLKIRISRELFEHFITRDDQGRRLSMDIGDPDGEGFYTPTVTIHADDILASDVLEYDPQRDQIVFEATPLERHGVAEIERIRDMLAQFAQPGGKPIAITGGHIRVLRGPLIAMAVPDGTVDLSSRSDMVGLAAAMIEANSSDIDALLEMLEGSLSDEGSGADPKSDAEDLICMLTAIGRAEAIEGSR